MPRFRIEVRNTGRPDSRHGRKPILAISPGLRIGTGRSMTKSLVKRSVVVAGRKTSVSLEEPFWGALKEIAVLNQIALSTLVQEIDRGRDAGNLSSALRVFVLEYFRSNSAAALPEAAK